MPRPSKRLLFSLAFMATLALLTLRSGAGMAWYAPLALDRAPRPEACCGTVMGEADAGVVAGGKCAPGAVCREEQAAVKKKMSGDERRALRQQVQDVERELRGKRQKPPR